MLKVCQAGTEAVSRNFDKRRNPAGPAIRNEDNSSSLNMVINIIGSIVRIV